jgi:hypothetical protein
MIGRRENDDKDKDEYKGEYKFEPTMMETAADTPASEDKGKEEKYNMDESDEVRKMTLRSYGDHSRQKKTKTCKSCYCEAESMTKDKYEEKED